MRRALCEVNSRFLRRTYSQCPQNIAHVRAAAVTCVALSASEIAALSFIRRRRQIRLRRTWLDLIWQGTVTRVADCRPEPV